MRNDRKLLPKFPLDGRVPNLCAPTGNPMEQNDGTPIWKHLAGASQLAG